MEKVSGIGGLFFRAKDPEALAKWYLDNLGVSLVPTGPDTPPWQTEAGTTIFAPFPADTDYFRTESQFMINFRVRDLEAMIRQLESAGIEVFNRSQMEGVGAFAHLQDPQGTPIELWQPA